MREDMHKVVVERPRLNPGPGKYGRRANLPDELLPKFEGIKCPHVRRKGLTDLLGPLKRWLHSQAGRSWNDVYSEASVFSRCECASFISNRNPQLRRSHGKSRVPSRQSVFSRSPVNDGKDSRPRRR